MNTYKKSTVVLASLGMILATAIWGFAFVVVKESVDVIPPLYMLAFRFTIAALGMTALFAGRLKHLTVKIWKHGAWLGFWMFLAYAMQTWGCKYTTAGKNAFITVTYVVIVPFLSWLLFGKKPSAYSLAAAVLALIGVGMLSLNGEGGINRGDLLTLGCGIFYAIQMVYVNRYTQKEDPVLLTLVQIITSMVLAWMTAPVIEGAVPVRGLSGQMLGSMLYLGLLSTMAAFLLQNIGQKYTPPATAALFLSMESVFGALSSAIFLKERISPKMFVGCAILFFAILLAETRFEFLPFVRKREEADA